jgi:hypothetical protein
VAGTLNRAQYLAGIGALDGGCQALLSSLQFNPWNFYAYPRTHWNTNQTAGTIEQEFFKGYFGEAAAPALAYYQTIENYQVSNNVNMHYSGYAYGITPGSYPIGLLATMQTNVLAAEALATNWWVQQRVANLAAGFNWIITNSPDNLAGQNLDATNSYPVLNPTTNGPTTIDLTSLQPTQGLITGNNVSWQSGTANWWMASPGELQETFNMVGGTYLVNVTANDNSPTGELPPLQVFFAGANGTAIVSSTNQVVYSFTLSVPSGVSDMVISLPNNTHSSLDLDKITVTRE